MGISLQQWRAKIGTFIQPNKSRVSTKTLELKYVSLCIRTVLFYLLIAEGIEVNPGPPTRRGTQGSRGGARGTGSPRGRGSGYNRPDYFANMDNQIESGSIRRSDRIRGQSSLNAWLTNTQTQSQSQLGNIPSQAEQLPSGDQTSEQSDTDIDTDVFGAGANLEGGQNMTEILLEIRRDVKCMNKKFDSMEKTVGDLKKDNKQLKQQNESMSRQITDLTTSIIKLESRTAEIERKNEQIEAQSRRDNLKFYGIADETKESWEQSEVKIREYIKTELNIDESNVKIERAHRLPSKTSPRPIIAKFSFYKDKETILKAYRQKRRDERNVETAPDVDGEEAVSLQQRAVRVSEDFPERVTKARTKLFPFLKSCLENEKNAYLRFDSLVVDGQPYVYDDEMGRPVPFHR